MGFPRPLVPLLVAALLAAPSGKGVRLSRIQAPGLGTAQQVSFAPDGATLYYVADQESDDVRLLYAADAAGGAEPTRIVTDSPSRYALSPDGAWLVYLSLGGLFTRSLLGDPTPILLSPEAQAFEISADSSLVVFNKTISSTAVAVLTVPIDGGAAPVALAAVVYPDVLGSFDLSPDSERVLLAIQGSVLVGQGVVELASVSVFGGPVVSLTPPLGSAVDAIGTFGIDPDSDRVVYTLLQIVLLPMGGYGAVTREIHSVPLEGGAAAVRLNNPATASSYVSLPPRIDGTGTRVVYVGGASSSDPAELYSAPLDGSAAPLKLSPALPPGTQVLHRPLVVSPDGQRVLYLTLPQTLYSVRIDGSAPSIPLVAGFPPDQGLVWPYPSPAISADGTRAVYLADGDANDVFELYSAPLDGASAPVRLNEVPVPGGDVASFLVAPLGDRVAYLADQDQDGTLEVYSAPLDGAAPPARISRLTPGPLAGDVFAFEVCGARALYRADQVVADQAELYSVPVDGSAEPVRLNGPLAALGDVQEWACSEPAGRVVYRADQETNDKFELYSAPLDGSAAPLRLNPALTSGRDVTGFVLVPDGTRVLFQSDKATNDEYRLYVVPIDGSAAAVTVDAPPVPGGDVYSYAADPTSTWAVYRADQEQNDVIELYARPLDRSSPAHTLNDAASTGVEDFRIDAAGERVVYRAGLRLHVAPIDGSAAPLTLTSPPPSGGHVLEFAIDPAGTRVVFRGDLKTDEDFELFSVPLDASTPAVRLSPPLVSGGDVSGFQLTPLGERVCFSADALVDARFQAFSVPIDGSTAPIALYVDPQTQGSFVSYSFDLSEALVVYREYQAGEELLALFQRPLDGSTAAVRLSPPGVATTLTPPRAVGLDVLYTTATELLSVPLRGGPSRRLSQELGPGQSIEQFYPLQVAAGRVVYRASEIPGVVELYSSPLVPAALRR